MASVNSCITVHIIAKVKRRLRFNLFLGIARILANVITRLLRFELEVKQA